ncbi:MAG: hypothetical protein M1820_000192 [Bogoriella megaspora]|nr:MAG: hypothetical protein M1820_000192 [Bogoriella megaspora]
MNPLLSFILTILYYLILPVWLILFWLYRAVRPVYHALAFLVLPVVYVGHFLQYLVTLPFYFLAQFETLYIYLGVASLVGLVTGVTVYVILQLISSVFGLYAEEEKSELPKRTVASYRAARRKKKLGNVRDSIMSPVYLSRSEKESNTHLGLLSQTILEEDDSDF